MDLHGFEVGEFLIQWRPEDSDLKKSLISNNPEMFQKARLERLKSLVESGQRVVKMLEAKKAETVEGVRKELSQHEIGSVLHCAVPPAQCWGEAKKAATPAPGLDVELRTHGDDPKNPQAFHFSGRTNGQGQFVIPAVPVGGYDIVADLLLIDQGVHYRGNLRQFYVQGNEEVLILDLPVEKVKVTVRPGKPRKS